MENGGKSRGVKIICWSVLPAFTLAKNLNKIYFATLESRYLQDSLKGALKLNIEVSYMQLIMLMLIVEAIKLLNNSKYKWPKAGQLKVNT